MSRQDSIVVFAGFFSPPTTSTTEKATASDNLTDDTAAVCLLGLLVKHFRLCRKIITALDKIV